MAWHAADFNSFRSVNARVTAMLSVARWHYLPNAKHIVKRKTRNVICHLLFILRMTNDK